MNEQEKLAASVRYLASAATIALPPSVGGEVLYLPGHRTEAGLP